MPPRQRDLWTRAAARGGGDVAAGMCVCREQIDVCTYHMSVCRWIGFIVFFFRWLTDVGLFVDASI